MANYIQTLQARIAELEQNAALAVVEITEFRTLLLSPKHQGEQADGTRNDWISTADALRRLDMVREALGQL